MGFNILKSVLRKEIEHIEFLLDQGGFAKLLDHIRENILFDLRHGTNTSSWLQTHEFGDKPKNLEHGVRYRAAAASEITQALHKASRMIDPAQASFYDLGCGKGKTLCVAALNHNFNRIAGIDYYQPFIEQARENTSACGAKNVQLYFNDMAEFKDFDKNSVIFLYNPADDFILEQVRKNIESAAERAVLIYNKPVHADVFKEWDCISEKKSPDPDHCTNIYFFNAQP